MIGERLSRYEILEKLGEGGMGVVYKARDRRLERLVAIKILPAEKILDPDRKRRFIQEAKSASGLNHPNIVTIHDIGEDRGIDFIVMEYLPGRTLDQMIPRAGLRLANALNYAIPVADALARAHAMGIVHRDLKPSNILVSDEGAPKLLDFGLAKLIDQKPGGDLAETQPPTGQAPLTEQGAIQGTVAYMSPEQADGKAVDSRSDIFSFGPNYFATLSIPIVRGRDFDVSHQAGGPVAAIVNETFARTYFPGLEAIGEAIQTAGELEALSSASCGITESIRLGRRQSRSSTSLTRSDRET